MFSMKAFLCDQRGATAIEYALIAALIATAIVAALITTGTTLSDAFQRVVNMFP